MTQHHTLSVLSSLCALALVACATTSQTEKSDGYRDPVQDIIDAANISGITAKASPACAGDATASHFAAVGYHNTRMRNGQSAAGYSRSRDGTYAVGAVRKFTFLFEAHPASEDGCLNPDELLWNWDTDAQWVERDLNIDAATLAFEERLFHAAAAMGFGLSQYAPRAQVTNTHLSPVLRKELKALLLSRGDAKTLRSLAAAALAQLHVGAHYDRAQNTNDDAWLRRTLDLYILLGDGTDPSLTANAVCSAVPTRSNRRLRTCTEQAHELLEERVVTEPDEPEIKTETTTLAAMAESAPIDASDAYIDLLFTLDAEPDIASLKAKLRELEISKHPSIIGAGATGWALLVGDGTVLKLSIEAETMAIGISDLVTQHRGLVALAHAGFAVTAPERDVFLVRPPNGEAYGALITRQATGLKPFALAAELKKQADVPQGLTIGAFYQIYVAAAESALANAGLSLDDNDDNYVFVGDKQSLVERLKAHRSNATRWELGDDMLEKVDPALVAGGRQDEVTQIVRKWEHELTLENMSAIRAEFFLPLFGINDAELKSMMEHYANVIRRSSLVTNDALLEYLKTNIVAVDPCI